MGPRWLRSGVNCQVASRAAWPALGLARRDAVRVVLAAAMAALGSGAAVLADDGLVGQRVVVVEAAPIGVNDRVIRTARVGDVLIVGAVRAGWVYSATDRGWIREDAVRRPAEAVAVLQRGRGRPGGLNELAVGVALAEAGRLEEALKAFGAAEAAGASEPVLWLRRGAVYLRLRRYEEAAADFSRVIASGAPRLLAEAHNNRSVAYAGLGRFDAALEDAERAVALQPENPVFLNTRGVAYRGLGRLDEAAADFTHALAVFPRYAKALVNRGTIAARREQWMTAASYFEAARALTPDDPFVLNELAWLLATCPADEVRDGRRAVELARTACRLTKRGDFNYLDTLAAALAEDGQFAAAATVAREALRKAPPDAREEIRQRLSLYEAKRPFRQDARGG